VARLLNEMDDRPPGEIRLLFQPSEEMQDTEGKSGAMRMIDDGALEDLDAVIALHVASQMPAGMIEIRSGFACAAVDSFYATIRGTGAHGAYPHKGTDPVFMLAQLINAIHGIRARRIDPVKPAVISIGAIHAGDVSNVIPAEVKINGTMRSYDDDVRLQLRAELEQAFGVVRALGGDYDLSFEIGYDPMYNDPDVSSLIETTAGELFGADRLYPAEAGMGAEDFGYMTRKAPGAMFMLGAQYDEMNRPHHSPVFDIAESSFHTGAALLTETACRLLKQHAR
jgi:amidohydrolase